MKTEQIYKLFRESAGVSTDSRAVKSGQLFFALWGEKFNGNKYAKQALDNGASWAIIDDPLYETERTILVDDCLFELQALARHYRKELNVPVLAIAGTNGKTTTKELLAAILAKKYRIHFTKGNLNNQIGVPLTILSAPAGTEMMMIEMGANHIGEIQSLCSIAKPDYGIITNIGTAHIEGFGSFEGVVKAKTELYEHLKKVNGVALYNEKDPLLQEKIFKTVNRAVPFSDPTGILLTLEEVPSDMNLELIAKYHHEKYVIKTNLFGSYNYWNIKAAIATGLFFEVEMKDIVAAIESYQPANNRSQILKTQNNTIICDSYNANPSSMKLALESFAALNSEKKLVILGDMFELGEKSEDEHVKILEELHKLGLENVLLAGEMFQKAACGSKFRSFSDVNELVRFLKQESVKGFTILVKGSRGMGLEKTYEIL